MTKIPQRVKNSLTKCWCGIIPFCVILEGCTADFDVDNEHVYEHVFYQEDNPKSETDTETDTSFDDETDFDTGTTSDTNHTNPSCDDGILNGGETGVDCGGSCPACPTCDDGILNGDETGVDCGGSCPACPTCNDGAQNGEETGLDCGGTCPACVDPVFSSPTPDISIPADCFAPNEDIIITKHNPSSNPSMDWIWVPDDKDWWTYMPNSEYQYQAPEKTGSYELKFYWNDAGDKDTRSSLTFQVSNSCP